MSSHLGRGPAFPSSLGRRASRPTETTADPLQLDSIAGRMLRATAPGRHGRAGPGQAGLGWAGWGGLVCVGGMWEAWGGREREREGGFAPFSARLGLFMLH